MQTSVRLSTIRKTGHYQLRKLMMVLFPRTIAGKLHLMMFAVIVVMLLLGLLLLGNAAIVNRSLQNQSVHQEEADRVDELFHSITDISYKLEALTENSEDHLIPLIIAENETLLPNLYAYRSFAETHQLTGVIEFTEENEALFIRIHADVQTVITLYRVGDFEQAHEVRSRVYRSIRYLLT